LPPGLIVPQNNTLFDYVLLETVLLGIELDVPCHMTVRTYAEQCAAVSTQGVEMRLPLQNNEIPEIRAA
jgi:hypothetical protein